MLVKETLSQLLLKTALVLEVDWMQWTSRRNDSLSILWFKGHIHFPTPTYLILSHTMKTKASAFQGFVFSALKILKGEQKDFF